MFQPAARDSLPAADVADAKHCFRDVDTPLVRAAYCVRGVGRAALVRQLAGLVGNSELAGLGDERSRGPEDISKLRALAGEAGDIAPTKCTCFAHTKQLQLQLLYALAISSCNCFCTQQLCTCAS